MSPVLSKPIDRRRLFPRFQVGKARFGFTIYELAPFAIPFPNAPMGLQRPVSVAHIRFSLGQG